MTAEVLGRVNEALARLACGVDASCVECNGDFSLKLLTALLCAAMSRV